MEHRKQGRQTVPQAPAKTCSQLVFPVEQALPATVSLRVSGANLKEAQPAVISQSIWHVPVTRHWNEMLQQWDVSCHTGRLNML
jgi:hypothetical protein